MSEIPPPPPPPPGTPPSPPRPFAPEPKPIPSGCSRPLLVGCAAAIVLVGIAGIVFVAFARDLLAWTVRQLEPQVTAALPADVSEAERERLARGFEAATARIESGELELPALYALQTQLTNAAEKSQAKQLTRDDVLDLLSALERVGGLLPAGEGGAAGPPAAEPAAAPAPP
jgi:hypothetical protein